MSILELSHLLTFNLIKLNFFLEFLKAFVPYPPVLNFPLLFLSYNAPQFYRIFPFWFPLILLPNKYTCIFVSQFLNFYKIALHIPSNCFLVLISPYDLLGFPLQNRMNIVISQGCSRSRLWVTMVFFPVLDSGCPAHFCSSGKAASFWPQPWTLITTFICLFLMASLPPATSPSFHAMILEHPLSCTKPESPHQQPLQSLNTRLHMRAVGLHSDSLFIAGYLWFLTHGDVYVYIQCD